MNASKPEGGEVSNLGFETRAIHTGRDFREGTGAVMPPLFLSSTFESGNPGGFDYARSCHPNHKNLEAQLAAMEGAAYATVFGSGVSAITAVVSTLKSGDCVVAEENIYGCTYRMFDQVFEKFGVRVHYTDLTNPANYAAIESESPAMVWIESPTNPSLKVIDIAAVAEHCNKAGCPLVVDNTFASCFNQRPLELGATLSLTSTTKYVNGHSDCLGGVVCTNDGEWEQRMDFARKALGLQPAAFDCWLVGRGAKTMGIRMERHQRNAGRLAHYLEEHPLVRDVRYPFLPSHPQYDVAKRQMRGGSGIVTVFFDLDLETTSVFLDRLKLFTLAESLGGIESLICHPASMTHASIPKEQREAVGVTDNLVRFSVGIEEVDDLIADIDQALARVAKGDGGV